MLKEVVILVAEDDDGHFLLITKALERIKPGSEIIRFVDGQETIDFLFTRATDTEQLQYKTYLLLLDIRLPKVDGIEILKKAREDEILKSLPIIILTTMSDTHQIKLCYNLGCNGYIIKPAEDKSFAEAIQQVDMFIQAAEFSQINDPDAYYNLGCDYLQECRFQEAINAFKQTLRLNPKDSQSFYNLGLAYAIIKKYDNAISAFQNALKINPNDPQTHYNLGNTYLLRGQKSKTLEQYYILKKMDHRLAEMLNVRLTNHTNKT